MKIIGHRGAKGEKAENTLEGFRYSFNNKVDGVELDIHCTKDQHLVVIHDDTLDRTTDRQGKISQMSLEDISSANAGDGEKVPLLSEVFDFYNDKDQEIMVEIKSSNCEQLLLKIIADYKIEDKIIIKSFNHRFLKTIRHLNKDVRIFPLLYGLPLDPVSLIKSIDGQGISISLSTVDQELVQQCHRSGYQVAVWNANTTEDFERLKSWSVDYICTDFPGVIKR